MRSATQRRTRRAARIAVTLFLTLGIAGCSTTGGLFAREDYRPSARLEPQEVVRILIEVLSDTEHPVHGVEVAYRFHTPEGPGNITSLEDYRMVLEQPEYLPLRTAFDVRYKPVIQLGTIAIQRIRVSSTEGVDADYVFSLRRDPDGRCPDCWLVLSIRPVAIIPQPPIDAI